MPNPYIQVALTYFRDPFRSMKRSLIVSGLLFFLCILFFVSGRPENHHTFKPFHLFLFGVLFAYWATHLKEQFANTRSSLTPDFRKIHGIVALIMAIVISVLMPGVMAPLISWQPLGFVSIMMLLFGAIIWFILRPGGSSALVIFVGFFSTYLPSIQNNLGQMALGYKPIQSFSFLGVGIVLSITGIIRYFLLTEEMPEYHLGLVFPIDGRIKMSGLQWQKMEKWHARGWRHRWTNKPIANMINNARRATGSCWSRIHRWSYSNLKVWMAIFLAIIINLVATVMDFINGKSLAVPVQFFIATLIPVFMAIGLFNVKNRFMAQDLMMPVRRDGYLKELGISYAVSQFIVWAMIMAVSIVWMSTVTVTPNFDSLPYTIVYSVMMQIWLFGLAVWLLSFRSIMMTFFFMNIAVIFTTMPILAFDVKMLMQWRPLIMLFGGLLATIGLLLTWWGYRRWFVTDLD